MDNRKTVMVRCINVSSDGEPVDVDGEDCAISGKRPLYTWEKKRVRIKWLEGHKEGKQWKKVKK